MTSNPFRSRSSRAGLAGAVAAIGALCTCGVAAAQVTAPAGYQSAVFATGGSGMTNPDDITQLNGVVYVVYQNGTQPDGSTGGDSNVVGYLPDGTQAGSWSVVGHADGLTADRNRLIVTVNEDANSSLYTITPRASASRQLRHYTYSPDPATLSGGGTDAISVVDGRILISASNPSPTMAGGSTFTGPAVYAARIPHHGSVATLTPVFDDNSAATDAVTGQSAPLNLSDPDSNAVVPRQSPSFGGDFVLDSQADSELIFDRHPGRRHQSLTVLHLTSTSGAPQVDDVRWSTGSSGTLFVVDAGTNQIDTITGPFGPGVVLTAIPSDSQAMPGVVGTIDLSSGAVSPFATGFTSPKGLLFEPARGGQHGHGDRPGQAGHGHQGPEGHHGDGGEGSHRGRGG